METLTNAMGQIAQYGAVGICLFVTIVFALIVKKLIEQNAHISDACQDLFSKQFQQMNDCFQKNSETMKGLSDIVANNTEAIKENSDVIQTLLLKIK